mgnify:CR=1 FL=1
MLGQMIREQIRFAETLMPRETGPEVGALEDLDEGNGLLIFLGIIRNVSDDFTSMMECERQPHLYQAKI